MLRVWAANLGKIAGAKTAEGSGKRIEGWQLVRGLTSLTFYHFPFDPLGHKFLCWKAAHNRWREGWLRRRNVLRGRRHCTLNYVNTLRPKLPLQKFQSR